MIAVIGVDYDEGSLDTYRGMTVMHHGKEVFRFKTEEKKDHPIIIDMMACVNFCIENNLKPYWSSSVDTFQSERHEDYVSELCSPSLP